MKVHEKEIEIEVGQLDGSAQEIAEKVFQHMVGPMYDEIKKIDLEQAKEFAFCIAGNAIACYLHTMPERSIDSTADLICSIVKSMAADIRQSKKKVS